jgi:quercetin dioxygenase-like cupin family protein
MLIRACDPQSTTPVTMEGAHGVTMQVMVGREDAAPNFAMRHFVVEPGGQTPRHQHPYEHEVYIAQGRFEVFCDGKTDTATAGDVLLVPSDTLHQFINTGDTPGRFLCLVPLESDCGQEVPGS